MAAVNAKNPITSELLVTFQMWKQESKVIIQGILKLKPTEQNLPTFIKPKDRYQLIDKCNIILLEKHGQIYLYFSYNYFLLIIHLKFFILSSNCHNYFLHFATQSK